jgi:hypothetical protein
MYMNAIIGGGITTAGGILAASSVIAKARANAQELIDKLVPYQGWIGACMFFWGVWETFESVRSVGQIGEIGVLSFAFMVLTAIADLLVGFLLAFGLATKYALGKNPAALERGQQIRGKLAAAQIPLGFLAIVMGLVYAVVVGIIG